jgi:type IV secretion system protein VirB1
MDLIPLILACAPFVSPDTMTTYIEQRSEADPLAIHITDTDRWIRPQSEAEAIAAATKLVEEGMDIEAGLAQIKSAEWAQYGLTPETVFDPCKSLGAAERVLVADYRAPKHSPPRSAQGRLMWRAGSRSYGMTQRRLMLPRRAAKAVLPSCNFYGS